LIYEANSRRESRAGRGNFRSMLTGRVNIKIPAGTQSGQKLRVRGRGPAAIGRFDCRHKIVGAVKNFRRGKKLWEQLKPESISSARLTHD